MDRMIDMKSLKDDPLMNKKQWQSDVKGKGRRPKRSKRTIWNALFSFTTRSHLPLLVCAFSVAIVAGLLYPVMSIFLGKIFGSFTSFSASTDSSVTFLSSLSSSCLGLTVIGILTFLLNGGALSTWVLFGEKQAENARYTLFESLCQKGIPWYDAREDGMAVFMVQCNSQIRELQIAASQPLGQVIQWFVTILASLGVAFFYSWRLTLVILASWPITFFTLSFAASRIEAALGSQKQFISQATRSITDAVTLIDLVKIYNGQAFQSKAFKDAHDKAASQYLLQARWNGVQFGMVSFIARCMFVQGFWYGAVLFKNGTGSAQDIVTTFWSCSFAAFSLNVISQQAIPLQQGLAAAVNLHKLVATKGSFSRLKIARPRKPATFQGDIEFHEVSFSYPTRPEVRVLDKVSMWFPAGEVTHIIGQSGSGKSTLSSLILGFYESGYGQIFVDDHPLHTYDVGYLRDQITLVQQNGTLLKGTILENLQIADQSLGSKDLGTIRDACRFADFLETVDELPDNINTLVTNDTSQLSGGQKQRLALARAKLRDTPILILDESTSALDELTRTRLMNQIRVWRKHATTIIITHELSQIREDDFVYVISKGQIRQEGYRRNLHGKAGVFERFHSRSSGEEEVERTAPKKRPASLINIERPPMTLISPLSPAGPDEVWNFHVPRRAMFNASLFGQAGGTRTSVIAPRPASPLLSPLVLPNPDGTVSTDFDVEPAALNSFPINRSAAFDARPSRPISMISEALGYTPMTSKGASSRPVLRDRWSKALPRLPRPISQSIAVQTQLAKQTYTVKQILATIVPNIPSHYRTLLTLGFIAAFVHAATTPVFAYLLAKLLGSFGNRDTLADVALKISLGMLAVAFADGFAVFWMHYLLEEVGEAWVDVLREQALSRVLDQPKTWFEQNRNTAAKIAETLDKHAEETRNFVGRFAGNIFVAVLTIGVGLLWSMIIGPKLTAVALSTSFILVGCTRASIIFSERWEGRTNDAHEEVGAIFQETFTNIRFIRAHNLEDRLRSKASQAARYALKIGSLRAVVSGTFFGIQEAIIVFIMALLFYYGGTLAASGTLTVQNILQTLSILIFGVTNFQVVIASIPQVSTSKDNASRLLRLVNLPRMSHEHMGMRQIDVDGDIVFRDVSFRYASRPEQLVLRQLNLTISSGECIAIAGASGSGKSTLIALLSRLHHPTSGQLLISDLPVSTQLTPYLRSQMALVPQTVTLFDGSIAENILYGLSMDQYSNHNLLSVAQAVGLYEWIAALPQGYSTPVGEGGALVSGGQAQRIAIARALIRAPKILILDECTSNLDEENAAGVRDCLRNLVDGRRGMTVVVVTHSREMMEMADRVAVLKQGSVVEDGTFQELAWRGGELTRILGEEQVNDSAEMVR